MCRLPTPEQFRHARVSLKLGLRSVARSAGCMTTTVSRLERGDVVPESVAKAVRDALQAAGASFDREAVRRKCEG